MEATKSQERRDAFERALEALLREGKFTSLNDWCKKAGVGFNTPSDFRKGLSDTMTDRTYRKLAEAAGVSVSFLLGEAPRLSEADQALINDLRDLPADERDDILDLLRRRAAAARERRSRDAG